MWHPSRRRNLWSKTCDPRIYQSSCFCLSLGYICEQWMVLVLYKLVPLKFIEVRSDISMVLDHSYLTASQWHPYQVPGMGVTDDSPSNCGKGGDEDCNDCRLLRRSNCHLCMYVCMYVCINLAHEQDVRQGQFLKQSLTRIQSFPSIRPVTIRSLKSLVCPSICPNLVGELLDSYLSYCNVTAVSLVKDLKSCRRVHFFWQ